MSEPCLSRSSLQEILVGLMTFLKLILSLTLAAAAVEGAELVPWSGLIGLCSVLLQTV